VKIFVYLNENRTKTQLLYSCNV